MGRGWVMYGLGSLAATAAAITHAFATRRQFYNAAIYLTTAKLDVLILGNLACMLALLLAHGMMRLFLGRLRGFEVENLVENGKYSVTEICLALTTFRQDIDFSGVFMFGSLLFLKCFHWILGSRIDHVARTHGFNLLAHVRLMGLLVFLLVCDWLHVSAILSSGSVFSLKSTVPTVHLLFAFEFTMLLLGLIVLAMQYCILVIDARADNQWSLKPALTFYIDVTYDIIRLFLYSSFFVVIGSYFGIPLHLIRELYVVFQTLKERISNYLRYKRLVRNLSDRFQDATPDEIRSRSDDQCIICREPMTTAKTLPCSHLFHFHCLRTWLERSSTCPICRAPIPDLTTAAPVPEPSPAEASSSPQEASSQQEASSAPARGDQGGGGLASRPAPVVDAHRTLLHQHTERLQREVQFHTDRLKELYVALDQMIAMQQQFECVEDGTSSMENVLAQ